MAKEPRVFRIDGLALRDDPKVVSPVRVETAWGCGVAVAVTGFVPEALIDVEVDGALRVQGAGTDPAASRALIDVAPPLVPGQRVRARQRIGETIGPWSDPAVVQDHRNYFPAGLPQPVIDPAPVFECGRMIGVSNLLTGCSMFVANRGNPIGARDGADDPTAVLVSPPPQPVGSEVIAHASLCGEFAPLSEDEFVQAAPETIPPLEFRPVYEGARVIAFRNVLPGARIVLSRNDVVMEPRPMPGPGWGYAINPPVAEGERLAAFQLLCDGKPPGQTARTIVEPCSRLPGPGAWAPQAGDSALRFHTFLPGGRLLVFAGDTKIGDGSGPLVQLTRPVRAGEALYALQRVGGCTSAQFLTLGVHCVAPPFAEDPSAPRLYPVGTSTFDAGPITLLPGFDHGVQGLIHYPGEFSGENAPFHERLGALGKVPLVVIAHGRGRSRDMDLPFRGFIFLQQQLARMGIASASIQLDDLSGGLGGARNSIRARARIIEATLAHFHDLDSGRAGGGILKGRIDLSRVALMGHSRGGEAVLVAAETVSQPRLRIKGVLSVAPTDFGASSRRPRGFAFMTVLPAADGDLVNCEGAKFYDSAEPAPFKCQVFVERANHNHFNTTWWDETYGDLDIMTREAQRQILSAYGCAFFRAILLGQDTIPYLDGRLRPEGVETGSCHLSFQMIRQTIVDDHQAEDGVSVNTLGGAGQAIEGPLPTEHPFEQGVPGRYNDSFFHRTRGLVVAAKEGTMFRFALDRPRDLRGLEVWIRAAEVYDGIKRTGLARFELGLEDNSGKRRWVSSDGVGGLPEPYARRAFDRSRGHPDKTKTMLKTLRFPARCFAMTALRAFNIRRVAAILIRTDLPDGRAIAFDDLEIVRPQELS